MVKGFLCVTESNNHLAVLYLQSYDKSEITAIMEEGNVELSSNCTSPISICKL